MKTIVLASAAAILAAGTAFADQVRVAVEPGSNISVHHFEFTPAMGPAFADPAVAGFDDDQGMLSADAVLVDPDTAPVGVSNQLPPGFDPDALIYIYDDDGNGVNTVVPIVID